ncbi:MFS transporter [Halobacteriales archaeon QS_8_69_26]|nr:MAG: MFS transporter [Halobacteriales archaeon QS_8_69_26]
MVPTPSLPRSLPPGFVLKYYAYRATMAVGFTAPIWYLYVLSNGVSYAELAVIDAVWWGGLVLFEIPTGYVGDRIGRRRGLVVASLMTVAAQVAMAGAGDFGHFLVIFAWWALAATFRSGTDDAWLYDALKARTDSDEFARIRGRGEAVKYVVAGVTALAGGYIASVSMPLAYLGSAAATALSVPVLLTFPAADGTANGGSNTESDDDRFTVLDALPVIRGAFTRAPLRTFVPYVGLFMGVFWGVNFFVQPVADGLGVSTTGLGWMFAGFTLLGAVVSYNAGAIRDRFGARGWFTVVPPLLGAVFVGVALLPAAAIPAFFLMRGLRGATTPLANQFINDRVGSVGRATLLSTAGMVYYVAIIPFELAAGSLADVVGPITTIGLFGAVLVTGSALFLAVGSPFGTGDAAPAEGTPAD